jgi:hypothetical protein
VRANVLSLSRIDDRVAAIYRSAGFDPGRPPGMGVLLPAYFAPQPCRVRVLEHVGCRAVRVVVGREADEAFVRIECGGARRFPTPFLGNLLARAIARDALERWPDSNVREEDLAAAIVLPTEALRHTSNFSAGEVARWLRTTVDLVERRRESTQLRLLVSSPGLARAAAQAVDLTHFCVKPA